MHIHLPAAVLSKCLSIALPECVAKQDGYFAFITLMIWGALSVQVTCLMVIWACASRIRASRMFAWCMRMLISSIAMDVADMHSDKRSGSDMHLDNDAKLKAKAPVHDRVTCGR